ncbi:MAG: hypothetical protein Q9167_005907 [Letrouitia subvulpina]
MPTNTDRQSSRSSQRNPNSPNLLGISHDSVAIQNRQASAGAVWNIGGANLHPPGPVEGISDGRGGLVGSRTNAPLYTARFAESDTTEDDLERYESRLAAALDIDRSRRMLDLSRSPEQDSSPGSDRMKRKLSQIQTKTRWKHGQWLREGDISLLDAPQLRDDYYCSVLAYCRSRKTLAVGLSSKVYLWSETSGVHYPDLDNERNAYVTSLSFSSHEGGHSILAIGRNDGHISLWSLFDVGTRFESQQPSAVACLAFKPVPTRRVSERFGMMVMTEELLVGDELGNVYYYAVEWISNQEVDIHGWHGAMSLLAKISVHSQQICGLAWSSDGEYFATGANDNACCLFEVKDILIPSHMPDSEAVIGPRTLQPVPSNLDLPDMLSSAQPQLISDGLVSQDYDSGLISSETEVRTPSSRTFVRRVLPGQNGTLDIGEGREKHKWAHSAAIKAIAFCPWQRGLIATGGGSNDRAIHFYHTFSGACLATISVQAQVTSLIWSNSRREIAATFGYAQPEHPYRIAVFSWPDCRQVVAIPWASEMRALHAIPYPGGPNETGKQSGEGETWWSRTAEEGCIVVACSDESVKFHEVWTGKKKSVGGVKGLLGGSDILEAMEGFDKEGAEVIR